MVVPSVGLLLLVVVVTAAEGVPSATATATATKAVASESIPWDRLLLLGFFGSLIVSYLAWFAYHIWQGTMGVLLWRLGVAPEAYACLNVASTLALITAKAKSYKEFTPAIVLGHRDLKDKDILRLAEGIRSVPEAGVLMLDIALNFSLSTDGVKAFLQALFEGEKPSVVEELDLSGLRIDPIASGLFEAPLQQVTLKGCGLDAKQLVGIMFRVTTATQNKKQHDHTMSHLDLSYNDFGTLRLDVALPPLMVLALESCNLRDVVIEALFGHGKLKKSTLVEINLAKNALTDASAKLLALQLPDSKVEQLDLKENRMTGKALLPFLEVHTKHGAWARVALQGNDGISDAEIREFHTKFTAPPQCEPCGF